LDFCYHESVTHAGISSYGRNPDPNFEHPVLAQGVVCGGVDSVGAVPLRVAWAEVQEPRRCKKSSLADLRCKLEPKLLIVVCEDNKPSSA
jgi:hypothetical protein